MELFNALSLKEVANIVNSLGASVDISSIKGCINTGDKLITYIKEGNELTAYSSEGMMTTVKIDYSCHEQRNTKYLSHPVTIEYYLKDGAVIRLSNDLSLPEGLEAFEYVQRHDLIHRMEVK